jgi:hypothetical protein
VRGIAFVAPLRGALFFQSPMIDVEIVGNQIYDVVGMFVPGLGGTQADAISVGFSHGVIDYNVIENVNAEFGEGISQFRAVGSIEIVGN